MDENDFALLATIYIKYGQIKYGVLVNDKVCLKK